MALTEVVSGIKWGAFTGLLFSATAISITYLYIKKPLGLHLIDGFYHVLGQAIAGAIVVKNIRIKDPVMITATPFFASGSFMLIC